MVHRRRSIEEKASKRPQCLSVGDVVPNEKAGARLGTQPTGGKKKGIYFEIILVDFKLKLQELNLMSGVCSWITLEKSVF